MADFRLLVGKHKMCMNAPRIVTFYTPGPYADEAEGLKASASALGLSVDARLMTPFASWQDAVCWKPSFILDRLCELEIGEGLLWVDADARFRQVPDWSILEGADYGFCKFQWTKGHPIESLTGCLYFRQLMKVHNFLADWIVATAHWQGVNRDTPEQKALLGTHNDAPRLGRKLRFRELPKTWLWIVPEFFNMYPNEKPVIAHYQASRKWRTA